MTDTRLLLNHIKTSGLQKSKICSALGMTYATLRGRIQNESEFTASEIQKLTDMLGLDDIEMKSIFFCSST